MIRTAYLRVSCSTDGRVLDVNGKPVPVAGLVVYIDTADPYPAVRCCSGDLPVSDAWRVLCVIPGSVQVAN